MKEEYNKHQFVEQLSRILWVWDEKFDDLFTKFIKATECKILPILDFSMFPKNKIHEYNQKLFYPDPNKFYVEWESPEFLYGVLSPPETRLKVAILEKCILLLMKNKVDMDRISQFISEIKGIFLDHEILDINRRRITCGMCERIIIGKLENQ